MPSLTSFPQLLSAFKKPVDSVLLKWARTDHHLSGLPFDLFGFRITSAQHTFIVSDQRLLPEVKDALFSWGLPSENPRIPLVCKKVGPVYCLKLGTSSTIPQTQNVAVKVSRKGKAIVLR